MYLWVLSANAHLCCNAVSYNCEGGIKIELAVQFLQVAIAVISSLSNIYEWVATSFGSTGKQKSNYRNEKMVEVELGAYFLSDDTGIL